MKNIFDYATKELSQDAFLCWLFENFNCEDNDSLKNASEFVLKKFCKIIDEEIENVKTYSQWHKIDIFTIVKTNKRNIALFIEDKVFSLEHNQLENYNEQIMKSYRNNGGELNKLGCAENNIVKVFYKTLWLTKKETDAVKKAGWQIYDIECISSLFNQFDGTDCILLKQYIEHIKEIEKACKTKQMPTSNEKGLDLIKWRAYFEFKIIPKLRLDTEKYVSNAFVGSYGYTCLCIRKKTETGDNVPYIELRSRDIKEDGFSVTLLCYRVDYKKHGDEIKKITERINRAPNKVFISKYRRSDKPKQLGRTEMTSSKKIISFLKKCIEDYDFIMQEWK